MEADRKRILQLEAVIRQMLQPLKGIPLDLIIEGFSGAKVIPFELENKDDQALRSLLEDAARYALKDMMARPLKKRRPNEVGNAIEPYVREAIAAQNLRVATPSGRSGRAQSAGYPDLLVFDAKNRPTYIECKTFSADTLDTTLRAFFSHPLQISKLRSMRAIFFLLLKWFAWGKRTALVFLQPAAPSFYARVACSVTSNTNSTRAIAKVIPNPPRFSRSGWMIECLEHDAK